MCAENFVRLTSTTRSASPQVWLAKHDVVGAQFLRELGFSERLSRLVEGHVQAKRYMFE